MIERFLHFDILGKYEGDLTVLVMLSKKSGFFYLDVMNNTHQTIRIATNVNEESFNKKFVQNNLNHSEKLIDVLLENVTDVWIKKKWYKPFELIPELRESMVKLVKEKYKKTEMWR